MDQHTTRILGIGGSNRDGSHTLTVLREVLDIAEGRGATIDLLSVRDVQLPVYDPSLANEDQPPALLRLLPRIQQADAFLFASPTYHGTVSGAVKNLLDAIDIFIDENRGNLAGRPVGLIAYGGPGAINTINALYHASRAIAGFVVPTILTVSHSQLSHDQSHIAAENVKKRASALVDEVLQLALLQHLARVTAGS